MDQGSPIPPQSADRRQDGPVERAKTVDEKRRRRLEDEVVGLEPRDVALAVFALRRGESAGRRASCGDRVAPRAPSGRAGAPADRSPLPGATARHRAPARSTGRAARNAQGPGGTRRGRSRSLDRFRQRQGRGFAQGIGSEQDRLCVRREDRLVGRNTLRRRGFARARRNPSRSAPSRSMMRRGHAKRLSCRGLSTSRWRKFSVSSCAFG